MTDAELLSVVEATWPPAETLTTGPWIIRNGQGGGKRVSAATVLGDWVDTDIPLAEQAMASLDQRPLFLIRDGDDFLDQALQSRGYRIVDPVVAYSAPASALLDPDLSPMAAFAHWPPLAVCRDIWADGEIGSARQAVMDRAKGPKCAILARVQDRPAGVAFVALHQKSAMLHALHVSKDARRIGAATVIMRKAAQWSVDHGAETLSLVVTVANAPARALYTSLGMAVCGHYHYRQM